MKKHIFTCCLSLMILSCTKENDLGVLKGDIIGEVNLLDQYGYQEKDMSGTTVTISNDEFSATIVTDELGSYKVQNVPFGVYNTKYEHNGYLERTPEKIKHIGGASATLSTYNMDQIPTYEVHLDSVVKQSHDIYAYGKMLNITKKPQYGYGFAFRFFISGNEQVSKDNYTNSVTGYGMLTTGTNIRIRIDWFDQNKGTFFLRPYALITSYYHRSDYLKALGNSSDIFQCTLN